MKNEIIKKINGKKIRIVEFNLFLIDEQLELFLKIYCDNSTLSLCFHNVSKLCVENLSFPLEVEGVEIICNNKNAWERERSYTICDFEQDKIKFFCEDIDLCDVE